MTNLFYLVARTGLESRNELRYEDPRIFNTGRGLCPVRVRCLLLGLNFYGEMNGSSRHKKSQLFLTGFYSSSEDRTRTCDLWVMSPTSYQLLHLAIRSANVRLLFTSLQKFSKKIICAQSRLYQHHRKS